MEKLSQVVLDAFGIQTRCIKKEKGYFLCSTESGLVKVHTTSESFEAIRLQHAIKEHLAERGFFQTGRFRLTKTGQPYILIGREAYVATNLPPKQPETNFENEDEVIQVFQSLAHFHIAASNMPEINIPVALPLQEIYTRQLAELTQAGKQARRGSRMSDFDVAFIKHAPHATKSIEYAINQIASTNYIPLYKNATNIKSLCHNALKEENLLVAANTTYIVNFTQATIDLQLNDLATLIRRYAHRSSKCIPANRLIDTYSDIFPLPQDAHHILHAQLIFPWAFMKLVSQYYSKKRNWTPNGLINRMDTTLAEQESYESYISALT